MPTDARRETRPDHRNMPACDAHADHIALPGGVSTNPQGVELEASSTPKPPSCTTLKSYFSYMANSYTDAEVNLAPTLPPDPLYPLYAPLRR